MYKQSLKKNIRTQIRGCTVLVLLVILGIFLSSSPLSVNSEESVFVDTTLLEEATEPVSVIVTAISAETAVSAIESVGGQVTSSLWLIDAAGATVTNTQLDDLITLPGIVSVVQNNGVKTAQDNGTDNRPDDDDDDTHDGYVTDRRRIFDTFGKGSNEDITKYLALAPLLDGGAVTASESGDVIIFDKDGNVNQVTIADGKFKTAIKIGQNGTIFLASEENHIFAINPAGSILWQYEGEEKFKAGVTLGQDDTVYAADEKGTVYALAPSSGQIVWQYSTGIGFELAPVIGADGTVYVLSEKGYLSAIKPDGSLQWTFKANGGNKFNFEPIIDSYSTIYIVNENKWVFAVNPNGTKKYRYRTNKKILIQPFLASDGRLFVFDEKQVISLNPNGTHSYKFTPEKGVKTQPLLAPDDSLFVVSEHILYGLNPDGSQRFAFTDSFGGKFITTPTLSPDGTQIYGVLDDNRLLALDTDSGELHWEHQTDGDLQSTPTVESNGDIHFGTSGGNGGRYTILSSEGGVIYSAKLFSELISSIFLSANEENAYLLTKDEIASVGILPDAWDGTPDVLPTNDSLVWEFLSPVTIDVGVDELHDADLQEQPITGVGVTVAVIDSGVYFDKETKDVLGNDVAELFLGQADFVADGNCVSTGGDYAQYDGYCWTNEKASRDDYGHGSHVAGIIWNHFTDADTGVDIGIAPDANILSVRVLGEDGIGTYEDVIEGIQYVVTNKDIFNIRVMNLSLSGYATTPYFVDPMNRAVEAAWAEGIVVLAAAGNSGPGAESITVPGNDPYVITVGAIDSNRTPGYWADDTIPTWSASGPTLDGFVKPDVLAPGSNIVSFMHNDPLNIKESAYLVQQHPDYAETTSLFRMNGTSMSTAVASGVVALMLDADPTLTPDEVKYRLMSSAKTAVSENNELVYSPLQQGAGRIWAPDAVLGTDFLEGVTANAGMDINNDLAHGWVMRDENGAPIFDEHGNPMLDETELTFHYQGSIQRVTSDDGQAHLYYHENSDDGSLIVLGAARVSDMTWMDHASLTASNLTFDTVEFNGSPWPHTDTWDSGVFSWGGGVFSWGGGVFSWGGGVFSWGGGVFSWAWGGGVFSWGGGVFSWGGGVDPNTTQVSSTSWVGD